jgi:hypothetical protein
MRDSVFGSGIDIAGAANLDGNNRDVSDVSVQSRSGCGGICVVEPAVSRKNLSLHRCSDIIRKTWTGKQIAHKGQYCSISARLYDPPAQRPARDQRRCGGVGDMLTGS